MKLLTRKQRLRRHRRRVKALIVAIRNHPQRAELTPRILVVLHPGGAQ